jgi:hypothetical protein
MSGKRRGLRPPLLRLGYAIHLIAPNVVLELSDQRQNTHDELAGGRIDCGIVGHLKGDLLLGKPRTVP